MAHAVEFSECEIEIASMAEDLRASLRVSFREAPDADHPVTILRSDQEGYVLVEWELVGKMARHFCGEWCLCLYLESIGPAAELKLPDNCIRIKMDPCRNEPYRYTFRIPPGAVDPGECGTLYLVAVTLGSFDLCGDPGHIFGYCRGPSLMFYPGGPHEDVVVN